MTLSNRDALVYVLVQGYERSHEFSLNANSAYEEVLQLKSSVGLTQTSRSLAYIKKELNNWETRDILKKDKEAYHLTALGKRRLSNISRRSSCFTGKQRRSPRRRNDRHEYTNNLRIVKKQARSYHSQLTSALNEENAMAPTSQHREPDVDLAPTISCPITDDYSMDVDATLVEDPDVGKSGSADLRTDDVLLDDILLNGKGKGRDFQPMQDPNTTNITVNDVFIDNLFGTSSLFPPRDGDITAQIQSFQTPTPSPSSRLVSTPNAPGPLRILPHTHTYAHANETQVSPTPVHGVQTCLTDRRWPRKNAPQPLVLPSRDDDLSEDKEETCTEPSSPSLSSSTDFEINTPIQLEDELTFIVGEQDQDYDIGVNRILVDELEMRGYLSLPSSPAYSYSSQVQDRTNELDKMIEERDEALEALQQQLGKTIRERDTLLQERNVAYRFIAGILSSARTHVPRAFNFIETN